MVIESRYWKEDLLNHAKRLRPVKKPKRWSERAVVNFEKELIISFFANTSERYHLWKISTVFQRLQQFKKNFLRYILLP